jgi:hypothetical protein
MGRRIGTTTSLLPRCNAVELYDGRLRSIWNVSGDEWLAPFSCLITFCPLRSGRRERANDFSPWAAGSLQVSSASFLSVSGVRKPQARCYLKNVIPAASDNVCCVSWELGQVIEFLCRFRWRQQLCERTQIPPAFNPVAIAPEPAIATRKSPDLKPIPVKVARSLHA